MRATLGIDPGISGAVALLDGAVAPEVVDMPSNPRDLWDTLSAWRTDDLYAYVERAQAMPKQGVSSTFRYGYGYGVIIGLLAGLGIPYETVRPGEWKKRAGLIGRDKEASRALARQLWPTAPLGRVRDHGRAEALLIAKYGGTR